MQKLHLYLLILIYIVHGAYLSLVPGECLPPRQAVVLLPLLLAAHVHVRVDEVGVAVVGVAGSRHAVARHPASVQPGVRLEQLARVRVVALHTPQVSSVISTKRIKDKFALLWAGVKLICVCLMFT